MYCDKQIFYKRILPLLCMGINLFVGCSFSSKLVKPYTEKKYWTRTNLRHKDSEIHWKNYLDNPILPLGTPVTIVDISAGSCEIADNKNNFYTLLFPGESFEDAEKAIFFYLAETNPLEKIKRFPETIREKIKNGQPQTLMTKEHVLMAMGYPPLVFENHIYLDLNVWEYLEKKVEEEKEPLKKILQFQEDFSSNLLVSVTKNKGKLDRMKDYDNLDPTEMEEIIKKKLEDVDKSLIRSKTRVNY